MLRDLRCVLEHNEECSFPRALIVLEGDKYLERAYRRFRKFCRFEPETGCVLWTGAQTMGRGHNVPYGAFWFAGRKWAAHRWAAQYVHGFDIEELQVDHCCPNIPMPNTLCVQHVQPLTSERNRHLQTERRRHFIHLQVGLIQYEEVYGHPIDVGASIPFHIEPDWLGKTGDTYGSACPF